MTRRHLLPYFRQLGINIDLFATPENRIVPRYCSQYKYADQECHDALAYTLLPTDIAYMYPPSCLIFATIHELFRTSTRSVLMLHDFIGSNAGHSAAGRFSDYRLLIGS